MCPTQSSGAAEWLHRSGIDFPTLVHALNAVTMAGANTESRSLSTSSLLMMASKSPLSASTIVCALRSRWCSVGALALGAAFSTASSLAWAASSIPGVAAMLSLPSGSSAPAAWWAGGAARRSAAVSGPRHAEGTSSGSWCGLLGGCGLRGLLLLEVLANDHPHLGASGPVVLGGAGADPLEQLGRHAQGEGVEFGFVAHPYIVDERYRSTKPRAARCCP
jgi:hypothetical protein